VEKIIQSIESLTETQHLFLSFILGAVFAFLGYRVAKKNGREPILWGALGIFLPAINLILLSIVIALMDGPKKAGAKTSDEHTTYNKEGKAFSHDLSEEPLISELAVKANEDQVDVKKDSALLWYYVDSKEKEKKGSYLFEELQALFKKEIISSDTFVWSKGMESWKKVGELPDILEKMGQG
jgi:hypothetical protein